MYTTNKSAATPTVCSDAVCLCGSQQAGAVKAESSGEPPPSVAVVGAEVDSGRLQVTGPCPGDALTAAGLKNNM